MNRADESTRRIIELGEKGLKISEVQEMLKSEINASDVLSIIEEMSTRGIVYLSPLPKPSPREENLSPMLNFLWIEVTSKCNLKCIHCYAESEFQKGIDPSEEEIKLLIDEAYTLGCKMLQFTGGECVLRKDLHDLLKYSKFRGLEFVEVFTKWHPTHRRDSSLLC